MEVITILSTIKAMIELAELIAGKDALADVRKKFEEFAEKQPQIEAVKEFAEEVTKKLSAVLGEDRERTRRANLAAQQNSSIQKLGTAGALMLAFIFGASLLFSGCFAQKDYGLTELPETETTLPAYGFEWPSDVSRHPEHFVTVEVEGRMITTAPKLFFEKAD